MKKVVPIFSSVKKPKNLHINQDEFSLDLNIMISDSDTKLSNPERNLVESNLYLVIIILITPENFQFCVFCGKLNGRSDKEWDSTNIENAETHCYHGWHLHLKRFGRSFCSCEWRIAHKKFQAKISKTTLKYYVPNKLWEDLVSNCLRERREENWASGELSE